MTGLRAAVEALVEKFIQNGKDELSSEFGYSDLNIEAAITWDVAAARLGEVLAAARTQPEAADDTQAERIAAAVRAGLRAGWRDDYSVDSVAASVTQHVLAALRGGQ